VVILTTFNLCNLHGLCWGVLDMNFDFEIMVVTSTDGRFSPSSTNLIEPCDITELL
jgi:hypothetical protein